MNEHLQKIKYNKSSYEINNINSLLTQNLPINKSVYNSTDNSILSTKLNSSESLILKSLFINNDIRNFQMKNIKLKKNFFSTIKDIDDNSYKKFMKSKIFNKISKITLPKVENNNYKSLSPPPKQLTFNENITQKNFFSNNKDIQKYSFIQLKLRDELFNIYNFRHNKLGYNTHNNINIFNESIKRQALIKKYIYEQKKLYKKDLENNELFKNKIINNEIKIQNIYKLVSHNELNRLIDYNLFLQNKIHDIKEKDFELCKQIESLKKEIKNLFIKIKIESDKLWLLFDIRNFLICVKESISIKKLPLFFRFYNSDYIDELSKINDNDIFILEKMGKQKKNINLFRIPTNLLVYIKAQNTIEKEIVDKRFYKYFNSNYIIFNNAEEFLEKYILTEKVMLNHLRNSLIQNNFNESQKIKFMDQIEKMEKQNKIFEDQYNKTKKIYIDLKNNNINKKYMKLSLLREDDKNILNDDNNNKNKDKFLEKEKEFKNNENFLKLLQKRYNIEKNQFLLKYNELKNTKKFKTEKEYVYFFIYKNILSLFKIYPEYFYIQRKFCFKTMNLYINNIKNCHKFPDLIIKSNVIYLLTIYENAITNFLLDYKNNLEKYNSTKFYLKLKKNLVVNKKYILFQQQQILENKVKKMKLEKYNKKHTRYRYKKRNIVLSNTFTKFNRYNSFKNKNIKIKDDFCEDSNLLSY